MYGSIPRGRLISRRESDDLDRAGLIREAVMQSSRGRGGLLRRTMLSSRVNEQDLEPAVSDSEPEVDSADSSSTESTSEEEEKKKKKSKKEKQKEKAKSVSASRRRKGRDNVLAADDLANLFASLKPAAITPNNDTLDLLPPPPPPPGVAANATDIAQQVVQLLHQQEKAAERRKPGKSGSKLAFKRLDHVYDRKIHNFKLKETVKSDPKREEYDQVMLLLQI